MRRNSFISRPPTMRPLHMALLAVLLVQMLVFLLPGDMMAAQTNPVMWLNFTLVSDRVILPVRFGDSPELQIILDTGMRSTGIYLFRKENSNHLDPDKRI